MRHDEIVEEIGRLSETTSQLQAKLDKPKSRLDSFKEYAGVISLLLSLATGFFALSKTSARAVTCDWLLPSITIFACPHWKENFV